MSKAQFLVRNRHSNIWYGRVVIPHPLQSHFNRKREIRLSLGTTDKRVAKKRAMAFWVKCQHGFAMLSHEPTSIISFSAASEFLDCLNQDMNIKKRNPDLVDSGSLEPPKPSAMCEVVEWTDVFGRKTKVDLGGGSNAKTELELALALQRDSEELFERYKNHPEVFDWLFQIHKRHNRPLEFPRFGGPSVCRRVVNCGPASVSYNYQRGLIHTLPL